MVTILERCCATFPLVLVLLIGCESGKPAPTPVGNLVSLERNLGVIVSEKAVPIRERFQIINPADEPVSLRLLRRSCSCTGFQCDPPLIPPRSSATLTVIADAPPAGAQDFTIELKSTSANALNVMVSIHALIAPPLRISRLSDVIAAIGPEGQASVQFTVEAYADDPRPESACRIDESDQFAVSLVGHNVTNLGRAFHQQWEYTGTLKPPRDDAPSGVVTVRARCGEAEAEKLLR